MNSVLYNVIEYGADPCILKLVNTLWRDSICEIDRQVRQRVQWRIPDKSIEFIIMMLIDANDIDTLRRVIMYMSVPLVQWNLVSYLVESSNIASILYGRVKNRHTREMMRRLGIPLSIPEKEIFRLSSVIRNQTSISGVTSLRDIITLGYVDAIEILLKKAESNESISSEQLYSLLNAALSMTYNHDKPFNSAVIRWLYRNNKYHDCIPDDLYYLLDQGILDRYTKDSIMIRISLDTHHDRLKMIPANIFHQLGRNILAIAASSSLLCKNYLIAIESRKDVVPNIRVLDAITRHCRSNQIREKALSLIRRNGWDIYLVIDDE